MAYTHVYTEPEVRWGFGLTFLEIEPVTDSSLPDVGFVSSGNGQTLQMNIVAGRGAELV